MKQLFIVSIALLCAGFLHAQNFSCTSGEHSTQQYILHPELLVERDRLESFTQQYIATHSHDVARAGTTYVVPVVFHILHDGGAEMLTDSIIQLEVQHWNEYMSASNAELSGTAASFTNLIGNTHVEFRLAQKDPNGVCTNGIDRIYTQATYVGTDNTKLHDWPHDKYLNVWICKAVEEDATNYGVLAYSYVPSSVAGGNSGGDGIIAKYYVIGTNDPYYRPTLAHECGHWMNLSHTWGNSNSPGVACGDDNVNDTPPTKGTAGSCNVNRSECNPPTIENEQNIMNYSSCHFMFTAGQVSRMQAALNSTTASRNNVWSAANLSATGNTTANPISCAVPVADFTIDKRYICAGLSVTFTDASYNADVTSRVWTFPSDANITTATNAKPVITFYAPGWKQVTLQVTNANGTNQKTKTMVYVADGSSITAPYYENFEGIASAQALWQPINYDDNNTSFQYTQTAGHNSTSSYKLNNYDVTYDGDKDELVSPTFDLSSIAASNLTLSFDYAYASSSRWITGDTNVNMTVFASLNCGDTWNRIYGNSGTSLFNDGNKNATFTPATTDPYWKKVSLTLPVIYQNINVNFKWRVAGFTGTNNFYIDNINLANGTPSTGINEEIVSLQAINIVPNPTQGNANVNIDVATKANLSVLLYDMAGRELLTVYKGAVDAGAKQIPMNTEALSTGIYIVKVSDGSSTMQTRFVKL